MAITVIGTPVVAAGTTVALPTHAAGDLIVIAAYNGNTTTLATVPAAGGNVPTWSAITSIAGNSCSMITRYAVATGSTHTSGTWTNAVVLEATVLRGSDTGNVFWSVNGATGGAAAAITVPAVVQVFTDGSSYLLQFYGSNNSTNVGWNAAPAGYTRQAALGALAAGVFNSKDVTTSDGASTNNRISGSSTHFAALQIEIAGFSGLARPPLVVTQAVKTAANF